LLVTNDESRPPGPGRVHPAGADTCFSCAHNSEADRLPVRERIAVGAGWRVAHAIQVALPGWLVVVARRHVTALAELDAAEAAELGRLTWRASRALRAVTGCAKTYVAIFGEAEGFAHLHAHVIPRAVDAPPAARGPAVFDLLRRPPADWLPPAAMDDLARRLAAELAGG
jgi:diadenosine tetraphosphate (Ap4A) HIT family hydrolase